MSDDRRRRGATGCKEDPPVDIVSEDGSIELLLLPLSKEVKVVRLCVRETVGGTGTAFCSSEYGGGKTLMRFACLPVSWFVPLSESMFSGENISEQDWAVSVVAFMDNIKSCCSCIRKVCSSTLGLKSN